VSSDEFFVCQRAQPFNSTMLLYTLLKSFLKTKELESVEVAASQELSSFS
jgi:hypothetical protein